jgi:hypothetical protein
MKFLEIDRRPSIRALSTPAGRLALAVVCVIAILSAARSQDTPQRTGIALSATIGRPEDFGPGGAAG